MVKASKDYHVNPIISRDAIPGRSGAGRISVLRENEKLKEALSFMEAAAKHRVSPGETMVLEADGSSRDEKKLKNPLMSYLTYLRKTHKNLKLKGELDIIVRGKKGANEKQAKHGTIYLSAPIIS